MKEELVRKFVEKLDYSYSYKTIKERQNIINELCEIAGIEQLTIPVVVGQSEQLKCECKRPTFTRTVDEYFNPMCGKCGRTL